jgi:steroid 5-alpha reductase family enzyme
MPPIKSLREDGGSRGIPREPYFAPGTRGLLEIPLTLLGLNLSAAALFMVLFWIWSLRIRDVSIVDIAWGANGALISLLTFLLADGTFSRRVLLAGMGTLWGLRLSIHILSRGVGKEEDFRYAAMREAHGEAFSRRSLVTVFLFQALLIWVIAIPVQVGQMSQTPPELTVLDFAGLGLWILGFGIEVLADRQLREFRKDPSNRNRVLDLGLWKYSRHPNYFGESLIWWGIFLVAASTPRGWLTVFSPVLMTFLLLRVSGVPLLEEALSERREGYREYVNRTSSFFPWPPRRG